MEQEKWLDSMMTMAKLSFETGVRSMDTFQAQAEKTIEQMMKSASLMQSETVKAFDAWVENVKNARKAYLGAIEDGLANFEKQLSKQQGSQTGK